MSEEKIDAYTVYATTDYVDEQLNSANSSKLISHVLPIEATEENQTIFPINLETFDAANDTILVQDGITLLLPNSGFTIENNTIVMTTPWGLGDTGSILILKNTPILADEVAISGAVIENNSITLDKLSADITTELDELKKSASDGKALVAGAITDKGIETAADATFETMAANVESIVTLDSAPGLEAATWTPGTTDQVISAGNYLRGDQTIKGDANLIAANIAKGKSLFGVTGTYDPVTSSSLKVTTKNSSGTFTVPGKIVMVYVYNGTSSSFDALDSPGQNMLWIPGIEVFGYISGVSYEFARTVTSNTTVVIDYGYRYEVTLTINSNFNAITVDLGSELTESQYYTRIYYI